MNWHFSCLQYDPLGTTVRTAQTTDMLTVVLTDPGSTPGVDTIFVNFFWPPCCVSTQ